MYDAADYAEFLQPPNPYEQTKMLVHFDYFPEENKAKGALAGRPIYEMKEYIRIFTPRDKDTIIHREVTDADKDKYAREYAAWKAKEAKTEDGTPLTVVPSLDRAAVAELEAIKIKTIEKLAAVSDTTAQKDAGLAAYRQKARDYLTQAKGNAPVEALRAELASKEQEIAALKELLAEAKKAKKAA